MRPAADILAAARECLGTPFRHQGRLVGVGLDCAGVAAHVCRRLGLQPVDAVGYGRTPAHGLLESTLDRQPFLVRVVEGAPQPGDFLLMRFLGEPQHIAVLAEGTLIHAFEGVGTCCEHRLDDKWQRRIVSAYRLVSPIDE
jgi:NlpC/P60 family putative phage cell wall peptidase